MKLTDININELDIEEIGVWPLPVRILAISLIGVLICSIGFYFFIKPQLQNLNIQIKEQDNLRREFKIKYHQAINLDAYEHQMLEIENTYKSLLRQLPPSSQIPILINDISQQAKSNGLEYELIKPGIQNDLGFYIELPIELLIKGTYHGLGEFISSISKLPRIVTLHNFTINTRKIDKNTVNNSKKPLEMKVLAKTYWSKIKEEK